MSDGNGRKRMRDSTIRRRAVELLRAVDITPPLDLQVLCDRVGAQRGRPIVLVPYSFPDPTVFGLWLGTGTADLVLHEQAATESHRQHIVLHELGHIVFEHGDDGDGGLDTLLPTLSPDSVGRALRRSAYTSADEYEAEQFASVISAWAASATVAGASGSDLERAFDDPRGWL